jgi:hypothetical protein
MRCDALNHIVSRHRKNHSIEAIRECFPAPPECHSSWKLGTMDRSHAERIFCDARGGEPLAWLDLRSATCSRRIPSSTIAGGRPHDAWANPPVEQLTRTLRPMSDPQMRNIVRALGILSILWGCFQWQWKGWAFGASWHLGSPIRRQLRPTVDESIQSKICSEIYDTGVNVIHVLDRTLDLTTINAVIFIVLGVAFLFASGWVARRS